MSFTKVPNKLIELSEKGKLDCYDIAVYYAIFKHKNQKTGKCYPSIRRLAKILHIDTKTVMKHVKRLKECGIISYTTKRGVGNNYVSVGNDILKCGNSSYKTIRNNKIINNVKKIDYKGREKMLAALNTANGKAFNNLYERT